MATICKSGRSFVGHTLFQIAFCQLEPHRCILWIKIRDLRKYLESSLGSSGFRMRVCYRKVMGARFDDEILLRIEIGEAVCYFNIVRTQTIDLLEHRDRLEREVLFPIMITDAPKA